MSKLRVRGLESRAQKASNGILRFLKDCLERSKLGQILVMCGYVTAPELKYALTVQKAENAPLGQVLISNGMISRRQLALVLASQKAVRFMATLTICFLSLGVLQAQAETGNGKNIKGQFALASGAQPMSIYPPLFGADEARSENLSAFTKWTGMFARFDAALQTQSGQKFYRNVQKELWPYRQATLRRMAERVNSIMNEKKYILDKDNWGKSDYWATPIEFMARGGDCEDFAIAKYAALRAMNVPENYMRLAIVQDTQKNIPHALLIVYTEEGPVLLDNQTPEVYRADEVTRYKPIYSINRSAWWLHTAPGTTQVVAAAGE